MGILLGIKNFIFEILGFKRNSKYVKNYLNEANIKSSFYMALVVIILEAWMIIRSFIKYAIPDIQNGKNWFDAIFSTTSLYFLFMIMGFAMAIFAYSYMKQKITGSKRTLFINFLFPTILVLYTFLIFKEDLSKWNSNYYIVSNLGTIFLYILSMFFGLSIIGYTIYKIKNNKNNLILSIVVIVIFALICLTFGIKVGYTDYFSRFNLGTGLPKPKGDLYEIKSIICFLTMSIYVACLLIWKPYISIVMLTSIFIGNFYLLSSDPTNRYFPDGEMVNYITFLISLTMICISIYVQRVNEATKDESLELIAMEDDLTHIYNGRHFLAEAEKKLNDTADLEQYIFLFINIGNFSNYNDEKGFTEGNYLLIKFAKLIEQIFPNDLLARQSDDHFLVLTKVKDYEEKLVNLEQLLQNESKYFLQIKAGGYIPQNDYDKQNVRRCVDKARHAAGTIKLKYNKVFALYDKEMHEIHRRRQYIINNIDLAVEKGYIKAYYQPVVWSEDKKLCGFEALARWIDPTYGYLSPGEFIPILEEYRQIHKLDRCIFDIVCKNLREALDKNYNVVPVSVNFSRLDFELMDAVAEFEEIVKKYNIPKKFLHVEITESALMDNQEKLQAAINKLKNDGFAIWLDDFGSGYSSLNVLKDYDFDVLKVDMKFLSNFENNPKSKDILDCIIQLAAKIGMKTLTEGVETNEQADFLGKIGCGRLQGYLFGKPLPLDDVKEKFENNVFIVSDETI